MRPLDVIMAEFARNQGRLAELIAQCPEANVVLCHPEFADYAQLMVGPFRRFRVEPNPHIGEKMIYLVDEAGMQAAIEELTMPPEEWR